jgi:hypothetical protein
MEQRPALLHMPISKAEAEQKITIVRCFSLVPFANDCRLIRVQLEVRNSIQG